MTQCLCVFPRPPASPHLHIVNLHFANRVFPNEQTEDCFFAFSHSYTLTAQVRMRGCFTAHAWSHHHSLAIEFGHRLLDTKLHYNINSVSHALTAICFWISSI